MNLIYFIVTFYLVSSILYITHLWVQDKKLVRHAFYIGIAGLILHTANLIQIFSLSDGFNIEIPIILFIFSWLIGIVFFLSQMQFKAIILGAFILPIILLLTLPSLILPPGIINNDPSLNNPWILIHILLIFLGEAIFVISFIAGLLYIFQENKIKSKSISGFSNKLPSLITLDKINHFSLLLGFPFLTVGLAIGFILAKEILAENWVWGIKESLSSVTWLLYAFLINGRFSSGWKGRKSALGAVVGFIIILIIFAIGYIIPLQNY